MLGAYEDTRIAGSSFAGEQPDVVADQGFEIVPTFEGVEADAFGVDHEDERALGGEQVHEESRAVPEPILDQLVDLQGLAGRRRPREASETLESKQRGDRAPHAFRFAVDVDGHPAVLREERPGRPEMQEAEAGCRQFGRGPARDRALQGVLHAREERGARCSRAIAPQRDSRFDGLQDFGFTDADAVPERGSRLGAEGLGVFDSPTSQLHAGERRAREPQLGGRARRFAEVVAVELAGDGERLLRAAEVFVERAGRLDRRRSFVESELFQHQAAVVVQVGERVLLALVERILEVTLDALQRRVPVADRDPDTELALTRLVQRCGVAGLFEVESCRRIQSPSRRVTRQLGTPGGKVQASLNDAGPCDVVGVFGARELGFDLPLPFGGPTELEARERRVQAEPRCEAVDLRLGQLGLAVAECGLVLTVSVELDRVLERSVAIGALEAERAERDEQNRERRQSREASADASSIACRTSSGPYVLTVQRIVFGNSCALGGVHSVPRIGSLWATSARVAS